MVKKTEVTTGNSRPERPQAQYNNEAKNAQSFHPCRITLQTFRDLLSCYQTTVSQVRRRKTILKLQSKSKGGSKGKADKKAGATLSTKTKFDASEEQHIHEETDKFLELDRWRYEVLPKIVGERKVRDSQKEGSEAEGAHLLKEELVDIMDWKM